MNNIPTGEYVPSLPGKNPDEKDIHNSPANTAKTAPLGIEKILPPKGKDVSMDILKDKISEPPINAQKIEELQGKEIITPSRPKPKKYADEYIESHLKNITDKSALGHIHGDAFLENTGLEGNQSKYMCQLALSHIQNILENNELLDKPLNPKEIEILKKMESELTQAIKFANLWHNTSYVSPVKEQFAQLLKASLQQNQKCLIPGGWIGKTMGHAIYYHIEKNDQGTYSFRLYNTGAGAQFHTEKSLDSKNRILPFVQIKNIKEEDLLGDKVLQLITEMMCCSVDEFGQETQYSEKEIYDILIPQLKGDVVKPSLEDGLEYMTAQHSGTCSWKALLAYMRMTTLENYPPEQKEEAGLLFQRLKIHIKSASLGDYTTWHHDEIEKEPEQRKLTLKSCEAFLRTLKKLTQRRILSLKESQKLQAEVEKILEEVKGIEQKALQKNRSERQLSFNVHTDLGPSKNPPWSSFGLKTPFVHGPFAGGIDVKPPPLFADIYDWKVATKNVSDDLKNYRSELHKKYTEKNFEGVHQAIAHILDQLPIPTLSDKNFWNDFCKDNKSPEQAKSLIQTLGDLSELYMQTGFQIGSNNMFPMSSANCMIKAFAIQIYLTKFYSKQLDLQDLPLKINYRNFGAYNKEGSELRVKLSSPHIKEALEFQDILNYLDPFQVTNYEEASLSTVDRIMGVRQKETHKKGVYKINFETGIEIIMFIKSTSAKFEFIKKYLTKHPEKKQLLNSFYKLDSIYGKTEDLYLLLASYDLDGKILTPEYCALQKQLFWIDWLLEKYTVKPIDGDPFDPSLYKFESEVHIDSSKVQATRKIKGLDHKQLKCSPSWDQINVGYDLGNRDGYESLADSHKLTEFNLLPDMFVPINQPDLIPFEEWESLSRLMAHDKELWEWDSSLRIPKVISLFSAQSEKLREPWCQTFCKMCLFQGDSLSKYLSDNPDFTSTLSEFCYKLFQNAQQLEDRSTAVFALQMARYLNECVTLLQQRNIPIAPLADFTREKTMSYLLALRLGTQEISLERSLIDREIIGGFVGQNELSKEDFLFIWKSFFSLRLNPIEDDVALKDIYAEQDYRSVLAQSLPRLKKAMDTGIIRPEDFIDHLVEAIDPQLKGQTWKPKPAFPIFENTAGTLLINLYEGKIYETGKMRGALPSVILQDPSYVRVFGNAAYPVKKESDTCYSFVDEDKVPCIIFMDPMKKEPIIQKFLQGQWFQYTPSSLVNFDYAPLKQDYTHWVSAKEKDNEVKMLLVEPDSHQIAYTCRLSAGAGGAYVPEDIICQKEGHFKGLHLMNIYKESQGLSFLKHFENINHISVWTDAQGNPQIIDLSRYALQFNFSAQGQMVFKKHPLSVLQAVPGLEDFKNILVFDEPRKPHIKKVLIPSRDVFFAKKGSLNTDVDMMLENVPGIGKNAFYEYQLDSRNRLKSTSREANLFLAYLFLCKKDYPRAKEYLQEYGHKLHPFSEEENKIFAYIFGMLKESGDQSYAAWDVVLMALRIHRNNKLNIGEADSKLKPSSSYHAHSSRSSASAEWEEPPRASGGFLKDTGVPESIHSIFKGKKLWSNEATIISRPGKYLSESFYNYYMTAKTGTSEKKEELKNKLLLMQNDPYLDNKKLVAILLGVIEKPDVFLNPSNSYSQEDFKEHFIKPAQSVLEERIKASKDLGDRFKDLSERELKTRYPQPLLESPYVNKVSFEDRPLAPLSSLLPPQTNFETFFEKPSKETAWVADTTAPPSTRTKEEAMRSLLARLNPLTKDPIENKTFEALSKDINIASEQASKNDFEPKITAISALKQALAATKHKLETDLAEEKKQIMAIADKLPIEELSHLYENLALQGQQKQKLTLDDLIIAFLQQSSHIYMQLNPAFIETPTLVDKLHPLIFSYLEKATRLNVYKRAFENVETVERKSSKGKPIHPEIIKALYTDLTGHIRAYSPPEKWPQFLVYEYFSGLSLREPQVDNLKKMIEGQHPYVFLQMIMGSGKSKVLLPILALAKANGKNLSMVVVPESLYESSLDGLEETSREAFRQRAVTFNFSRSTAFTLGELNNIESTLLACIRNKQYLILTSKTLHNFNLKFQEALIELAGSPWENPELVAKIHKMQDILRIFKTQGDAIIDEADTILNCRHEVNYALGEAQPINPLYIDVCQDVYDILMDAQADMAFEFNIHRHPGTNAALAANYHAEIKPLLAQKILDKIENNPSKALEKLSEALKKLPKNVLITDYLLDKDTLQAKACEAWISHWKDPEIRNLLGLIKGQLNELLPMTAFRSVDEKFGFSSHNDRPFAIPYLGNNTPSETSQFDNNFEMLNYTFQMYYQKGLSLSRMQAHIQHLQNRVFLQQKLHPKLAIDNIPEYQEFRQLCPDPRISLFKVLDDPQAIKKICEDFKSHPVLIQAYLKKYILPQMKTYAKGLTSNSQNLIDIFAKVQGFTGTPWNSETYANKLEVQFEEGTDGKSLLLLSQHSQGKVHTLDEESVDSQLMAIAELQKTSPEPFQAIIDTGALFKGIANIDMARKILAMQPDRIKGVVFYDKDNKPAVLERKQDHPIPLRDCRLKEQERFTYYDQIHTTGSDIKQSPDAKAFVTISPTLILRDLLQGIWRLREIDKNQRIEILLPASIQQVIRKTLYLQSGDSIDIDEIIAFVYKNQIEQKAKDNVLAIKQKAQHLIQRFFVDKLLEINDPGKLKGATTALLELFLHDRLDAPFEQYGKQHMEIDSTAFLAELQRKVLAQLESYVEVAKPYMSIENPEADALKTSIKKIMDASLLRKKIPHSATTQERENMASEIEREKVEEAEKEQEKVDQSEKEKEMEKILEDAKNNPKHMYHWSWFLPASNIYEGELYQPYSLDKLGALNPQISRENENKMIIADDPPPVFKVSEAFTQFKDLESVAKYFDENLIASYNFYNLKPAQGYLPRHPFSWLKKRCEQCVVIREAESKKIKLMLTTDTDNSFFHHELQQDKQSTQGKRPLNICIYDFNLGPISEGQESMQPGLENDPDFLHLKVQAKFLRGDLHYTDAEVESLQSWLSTTDIVHMHRFFKNQILPRYHQDTTNYAHSPIAKIFDRKSSRINRNIESNP